MFSFGGNPTATSSTSNTNFASQPSTFNFGGPSASTTTTSNSLFGGASANTANTTVPSTSTNSFFNSSANSPFQSLQQQQQQQLQQQQTTVTSPSTYPFQYLQQCFDPNSVNYRFRAFFYNVADDLNEQQRTERQSLKPANVSDSLWAQVQADNPDPSQMIPVLANGFGDLDARAKWEDEALKAHTAKLEELHNKSAKLLRELDVDLTAKLTAAQQRHQALSLRLIKTMRVFEVLRRAGNRPSPTEIEAMTHLRQAASKLSMGSLESTTLRTTAFQLNSLADAGRLDAFKSAKALEVANEDAQAALLSALTDSQASLQKTVESVLKDAHDLHIIRSGYRPL